MIRPLRLLTISVRLVSLLGLAIAATIACGVVRGQEIRPDFLMLTDPAFDVPKSDVVLPEGAIGLWREMLARPEPDLVKAAADSIAKAKVEGFPGLLQCVPNLIAALQSSELPPETIYAVCRALIALDAENSADAMFTMSQQESPPFRQLIEPALAEWDYQPIRPVWRARLAEEGTFRRELLLACEGAGRVQDDEALPLLLAIVHQDSRPFDVRLAAARAAGAIASSGLEGDAEQLIPNTSPRLIDYLCAVSLIRNHTSAAAQERFLKFAEHNNPTVAAPALRALLEIDATLVLPLADRALQNEDANVRQCGLDAYIALPTSERIPLIAKTMNDPHPDVRSSARRALHGFSEDDSFKAAVRESAVNVLFGDDWRGQEQAALLLAVLDHEPAAQRLVELLGSARKEVRIAAAWALRMLAVSETKDGLLERARQVTEHVLTTRPHDRQPGSDLQLGHLFEALTVLGDERAVEVMQKHIPKDLSREKSRSAAIWGIGKLLEGQPDETLARAIMRRVSDVNSIPPELELVRQMGAVSLGRMKAASQLPAIKNLLGEFIVASPADHALAWAIERMDGELPPHLPPPTIIRRGWIIEPAPPRGTE